MANLWVISPYNLENKSVTESNEYNVKQATLFQWQYLVLKMNGKYILP